MKFIKRLIIFILIVFLVAIMYFTVNGYIMYKECVTQKSVEDRVTELRAQEDYTKLSEVPDYYKNAVVAIEDHRFYSHGGVDFIATTRAFIDNIVSLEIKGGGSSITQQVAKNLCFTQEKKLTRKVAELFAVHDLEKNYEKDEILEIYINKMYFGDGYYNIHDASYGYYNKAPSELSIYEATLLAGVPNAPSVYAPTVNLRLAEERQSQVLSAMVKYNKISQDEANEIKKMQKSK